VPAAADPARPAPGEPLLSADRLRLVVGGRTVLDGVAFDLARGEVVALLGRNGSGKSTLLRALAGLSKPAAGRLQRHGASVAYVPQDPNSVLLGPTVRHDVEATLRLLRRHDGGAVERWLTRLGLVAVAGRHPRDLSAGQRQRVAIATMAVGEPDVLLRDEPTRGMDADSNAALETAVAEHAAGGGAVVLATHDVELAARVATRVVVLGEGDVVADGDARTVLSGSLFAPQVLRVLPPFLTVEEVADAMRSRP
jgi:energy-coupling factor transport system ATP-binding protein